MTKVMADNVEYHERKYDEKRVAFGSAFVDAPRPCKRKVYRAGRFWRGARSLRGDRWTDAARGGFRILRSATSTPTEGPVGTPITVTVKGMGWQGFEQFMALRYDNKYTGEISAVTTKGTAVFQFRAGRTSRQAYHSTQQQHRLRAWRLSQHPAIAAGLYLRSSRQQTRVSFCVQRYQGRRPAARRSPVAGQRPGCPA